LVDEEQQEEARSWNASSVLFTIICIIVGLEIFSVQIIQSVSPYRFDIDPEKGKAVNALFFLGLSRWVGICAVIFGMYKITDSTIPRFKISRLMYGMVVSSGLMIIGLSIMGFTGSRFEGDILILILLVQVGIGPMAEEIFFRGTVYGVMRKRWGVISAALLSSLIFAAMHVINDVDILWIAIPFVGSFVMSFIYEMSKSLTLCAILHMGFNFVAVVFTA